MINQFDRHDFCCNSVIIIICHMPLIIIFYACQCNARLQTNWSWIPTLLLMKIVFALPK